MEQKLKLDRLRELIYTRVHAPFRARGNAFCSLLHEIVHEVLQRPGVCKESRGAAAIVDGISIAGMQTAKAADAWGRIYAVEEPLLALLQSDEVSRGRLKLLLRDSLDWV